MRASLLASAIAQHVVMQPLFGSLNPGFEPVGGPPGWLDPDQHDPCRLHEEDAQVSIATLGYLAEDRTIAGADLSWHQSKPCSEPQLWRSMRGESVSEGGEDARQLCPQEWCPCRTPSKAPPHFGPEEGATTKYRPKH